MSSKECLRVTGARRRSGAFARQLIGIVLLVFTLPAWGSEWCGVHTHPTGPLDYTKPDRHLRIVETHHFTQDVRELRRGATSHLVSDLEYVLNWFPNHHPALDAFSRLAIREGRTRPQGATADIECRFKWAVDVNPNDAMVRVIQGLYYLRLGRNDDARTQLQIAADMAPDHPEVHYNLGLVLYRLNDYEAAKSHAEKAYALGYPLPGLRNMLERAGHALSE